MKTTVYSKSEKFVETKDTLRKFNFLSPYLFIEVNSTFLGNSASEIRKATSLWILVVIAICTTGFLFCLRAFLNKHFSECVAANLTQFRHNVTIRLSKKNLELLRYNTDLNKGRKECWFLTLKQKLSEIFYTLNKYRLMRVTELRWVHSFLLCSYLYAPIDLDEHYAARS